MKLSEESSQKLACGVIGFIIGMLTLFFIFLPHYTRSVDMGHWAEKVIDDCISQYSDDFYDTIAEGDNWNNYVEAQRRLYNDKY